MVTFYGFAGRESDERFDGEEVIVGVDNKSRMAGENWKGFEDGVENTLEIDAILFPFQGSWPVGVKLSCFASLMVSRDRDFSTDSRRL